MQLLSAETANNSSNTDINTNSNTDTNTNENTDTSTNRACMCAEEVQPLSAETADIYQI